MIPYPNPAVKGVSNLSPLVYNMSMTQGTVLNGRYKLLSQQGSGGMAVIYKAQDLELGRTVAVKVLRPSLTSDPDFLRRFRQEARAVANLAHPNIVTVHDVGQDGHTHYIVMEFIQGQDLKKLIRAEAPFDVERAVNLAIQICAGVGYAHRAGLVHADIKPQNIMVTDDERVKVTDFGIARALSASRATGKQDVVWGSPHYFSPEQAAGEPPTPASDVYSIGVVMFEMLTGRLPFTGNDYQELALAHLREKPPMISDLNPRVPVKLARIVHKVLSKEPSARYRTADHLGRILITYREQMQQRTTHTPSMKPSRPPAPATTVPHQAPPTAMQTQVPTVPQAVRQPPARLRKDITRLESPQEAPKIDWVAVLLFIITTAAVLGLIPLWYAVFQLYLGF